MKMEAEQFHQLATGPWPSWNDDSFNEDQWNDNADIFEDSCIPAEYSLPLTPDFLGSPQFLTPIPQTDGSALGSAPKSTGYVAQLDPPRFELVSMMDDISPISSGGTTWTSPSLEFDFSSPVTDTAWPQFGCVQLDGMAQVGEDLTSNATIMAAMDTIQQSPAQPTPESNTWKGVQQPPPLFTTGPRPPTVEDPPPQMKARERRMADRPEKCPVSGCEKGHTYKGELKKHIRAKHRHLAAEYGISTERPVCPWCHESFARKDHLTRHLRRKHGREKHAKRRRKGERGDGI